MLPRHGTRILKLALVLVSIGLIVLNLDVAQATSAVLLVGNPSTTTISSSGDQSTVGQTVTFTVSVQGSGPTPAGTATVSVDGVNYFRCINISLDGSGQAACVIPNFNAGIHNVVATYSGNVDYAAGTSNTVVQTVSANSARGLHVGSCGTSSVKRYDAATGGYVSDFASGGGLACPYGLAFGPDGNLYVSSYGTGVLRFNGYTGSFIDTFLGSAVISLTQGLAVDSQGNLFVGNALYGTSDVKRRDHTGTVTTLDAPANYMAADISIRSDGDVFISDNLSSKFLHFNNAGTYIHGYSTITYVNNPVGNALGRDGLLYVAGGTWGYIRRYDPDTGAYIGSFATGLDSPQGIAFGPDGNLYVASRNTNTVVRLNGMTGALMDTFVAAGAGGLSQPQYLTFAPMLATTLSLTTSVNPSALGQSVTFTATVSETTPLTPTGTVEFKSGGVTIGACAAQPLDGLAQATCTVSNLAAGTHTISAVYGGSTDFESSTGTLSPDESVTKEADTLTLAASVNPARIGQAVTFTATVSKTTTLTPTGTIAFKHGGVTIAGCAAQPVNTAGKATCTVSNLSGGTHVISAEYGGDGDFASSSTTLSPDEAVFSESYLPLLRK